MVKFWAWLEQSDNNWNQSLFSGRLWNREWTPQLRTVLLQRILETVNNSEKTISFSEDQSGQEPFLLQDLLCSSSDQPLIDHSESGREDGVHPAGSVPEKLEKSALLASDSTRNPLSFKRNTYMLLMGKKISFLEYWKN